MSTILTQDKDRFRRIKRSAAGFGTGILIAGSALTFGATPAAAATGTISGTVVCNSGQPVVGVYVNSSKGGSGWASWQAQPGRSNVAKFSRGVTTTGGTSIRLDVGCGGTPSKWRGNNRTGTFTISGSDIRNVSCNDTTGTGTRCSLPPRGSTRSTNWFSPGYCTWGAAEKFRQVVGAYPNWSGNALDWDTNAAKAGWRVTSVPSPQSIFVFQANQGTNSSLGHVGYVRAIEYRSGATYIHTTEMNGSAGFNKWSNQVRKVPSGARFILLP
jgi:surface antigen